MWKYLIGLYSFARGGLYLYDGTMAFTFDAGTTTGDYVFGSGMVVLALFLMFAGAGVAGGQSWAQRVAVLVLLADAVVSAALLATSISVVYVPWIVASPIALAILVFLDPLGSENATDLDEDESVHGMTSF